MFKVVRGSFGSFVVKNYVGTLVLFGASGKQSVGVLAEAALSLQQTKPHLV
jgi:hypothetical protein